MASRPMERNTESHRQQQTEGPSTMGQSPGARPQHLTTEQMICESSAHEIINLMTTIVGNVALLKSSLPPNHPVLRKLTAIEQAAERAAQLSVRIRECSQDRRNTAELVNLNTIVYHVLLAEEQQLASRIRLVRYINPDLWRAVAGHRAMSEVALELVKNAVESIDDKGRVYIGTRNVDFGAEPPLLGVDIDTGRYVMLTVEDNGCGMSPEALQRVFVPGFSTKPGQQGMGLVRVQQLVSAVGGRISIKSTEGKGTVFRVYLPAYQEAEAVDSFPLDDLPRGSETVLLVDDERMIVDVASETLGRLGYKTLLVHNGLEAVELARTYDGAIDLILLDMVMPVMGGAEAFPMLRDARPEARVIVCTGLDQEIAAGGIPDDELSSFLLKPFRPSQLAQEVRRVLDETAHATHRLPTGSSAR